MSRVIGPCAWPRVRYAMRRVVDVERFRAVLIVVAPLRRLRRGRLHCLHLELDVDAIADQHAARLEQLVPLQAEVLAIDGRRRQEADALVTPRILRASAVLDVERDLAGDVADRQLADDAITLAAHLLDP